MICCRLFSLLLFTAYKTINIDFLKNEPENEKKKWNLVVCTFGSCRTKKNLCKTHRFNDTVIKIEHCCEKIVKVWRKNKQQHDTMSRSILYAHVINVNAHET